jgi:hypothetical protein
MTGLGMFDEKNKTSKNNNSVILFCTDWSRDTTHGSKFKIKRVDEAAIQRINSTDSTKTENVKISFNDCTLQEWRKINESNGIMANKIVIVIVRDYCYYPTII